MASARADCRRTRKGDDDDVEELTSTDVDRQQCGRACRHVGRLIDETSVVGVYCLPARRVVSDRERTA